MAEPQLEEHTNKLTRLHSKVISKSRAEPTRGERFLATKGHKTSMAKVKLYENFHLRMEKYRERTKQIKQDIAREISTADTAREY